MKRKIYIFLCLIFFIVGCTKQEASEKKTKLRAINQSLQLQKAQSEKSYTYKKPKFNLKKTKNEENIYEGSIVCSVCHVDIYKYWKNSMHALSFNDPIFRSSFMEVLLEFGDKGRQKCLKCHTPLVQINNDYYLKLPETKTGISCEFCHSVSSVNLDNQDNPFTFDKRVKFGPLKNVVSPKHQTKFSSLHQKSEFCGGCHNYKLNNIVVMGTFEEWKQSKYAKEGIQCQDCHMPKVEGKIVDPSIKKTEGKINLHNLQGGHSLEQLAKAAEVKIISIKNVDDLWTITVEVTNHGSGHKIPTGIPSRELILELNVKNAEDKIIYNDEVKFKKVLVDKNGKILEKDAEILTKSYAIMSDSRIAPAEKRQIYFKFVAKKDQKITVEANLFYHYEPLIFTPEKLLISITKDIVTYK